MVDRFDPETRRRVMSRIRARNTQPEIAVRRKLHARGYRYRLHDTRLPGTPDIVLPRFKTVVFVHGCFWHVHGCKRSTIPSTNEDYWRRKLQRNVTRDTLIESELESLGWKVFVIWECSINYGTENLLTYLDSLRS